MKTLIAAVVSLGALFFVNVLVGGESQSGSGILHENDFHDMQQFISKCPTVDPLDEAAAQGATVRMNGENIPCIGSLDD